MMEMIDGADDIVTKEGRSDQISLSKTKSRQEKNLLFEVCSVSFWRHFHPNLDDRRQVLVIFSIRLP